ncbi:hypothetical protein HPB52_002779 [Rhipicephalus sanguineus]|uniref:Uncharacterized protein n=1 Tax=Rhipicephalus sanguineus TaxID=34632 RepID=A0A9D4QGL9_RHISA|nr:hypothetical protein HPB52_002779 [Rhipicephalus sanguineus]
MAEGSVAPAEAEINVFLKYFDRTQAHPYENSSKYSSKSNLGSRYNDKVRESPSNGSHSRMGSPDSRHYHKSSSYNQRLKDRDKDHDRVRVRDIIDNAQEAC